MEIRNLLDQLGHELEKQQEDNVNKINYLCSENQQLKCILAKQKQNLIELAGMINKIASDMGDF